MEPRYNGIVMSFVNWGQIAWIENRISKFLLAAGVLLSLAGINRGLVFLMADYDAQPVSGPLLLLGILAAGVAIIGVYFKTRESSPILATVTGGFATLSLVAFSVFLVWIIASRVGPFSQAPGPLAIVGILAFMVSITLAGVTVIRSSSYPALVGYLLIGEALVLVLVFVVFSVVFPDRDPPGASLALELAQGIILLGAGFLTRDVTGPHAREPAD